MANKIKLDPIKPYLFIIAFLVIPLLLVPVLRKLKNESSFYQPKEQAINKDSSNQKNLKYGLVIHGGAGNFSADDLSPDDQAQYKAKLYEALQIGMSKIQQGDSAVHVVIEVIRILEDSPLFNAGKGAVFTHEGTNEMDASIMDGSNLNAGAIAGVRTIKNPITAAYQVMVHSPHVLLSGRGAESFAQEQNLELVSPDYFRTEKRLEQLQKALNKENKKMGTVGCVVLDQQGNLAAGTSTGGMTNKRYGRIGDSPIIGAGTYANNQTCAISATGHGEYFIRYAVAYDINAKMKYLHQSLNQAASETIFQLKKQGGDGGVIGMDNHGNITTAFNTTGMFRGYCTRDKEPVIQLFNN